MDREAKAGEGINLLRVFKAWRWRHTIFMIVVAVATFLWINDASAEGTPPCNESAYTVGLSSAAASSGVREQSWP